MGSKSNAWEAEILRLATGQASTFTGLGPNTLVPYLALFTGTLSGDTPGTEAVGGGYARVATAGKWAAPVPGAGTVGNSVMISFAQFVGSVSGLAPFTHFAIFDALTGGNALYFGELTDPTKEGALGDTVSFGIGELQLVEG